jgi:hypothetical protein
MIPTKPLPYPDCWGSAAEYVENLLEFATTSDMFQLLCGGVHILDFFTNEPGLFEMLLPQDWQDYLLQCDSMHLMDVLMRDDLDSIPEANKPPETLLQYIKDIRRFSLGREFSVKQENLPKMTRQVAVGMKPKKIHEVSNFASYVDQLADDIETISGQDITHFVDFGSGQNYLGRALASAPYNKHIVAVEGREINVTGAKELDMLAGIAEKEKVMRNKKLWQHMVDSKKTGLELDERTLKRLAKPPKASVDHVVDFRPTRELESVYKPEAGKGFIRYVSGKLESGDISDVVSQLEATPNTESPESGELRLMAISIHSCGNLSHHGIRSLILNPRVRSVAIVGCCYNLMTEKLGPPTYKAPYMRPSLQALNGRVARESARSDPQGFPMSERLSTYKDDGIRLNITARMMACQAPHNWGEHDSNDFFTRHFFRAVSQKIFLDKGVIKKVYQSAGDDQNAESVPRNIISTSPIIIGSLQKNCYKSMSSYIKGVISKLTTHSEYREHCDIVQEKMGDMTDEEIAQYESRYRDGKRQLSAIWTLMAFSAGVVESLIVTDRWLFLKQHAMVQHCWVETVFNYRESPRNLVVVGMKKRDP